MLIVKASVKPSPTQGLGLFADEKIFKGTSVWKFDPKWDILFSEEEVDKMSAFQKQFMNTYSYLSPIYNKYVFCSDDARFMNHSQTRDNITTKEFEGDETGIANRDIEPGEELLINYRTFDIHDTESKEEYLNT
jgi:SET domain-containing protein